MHMRMAIKTKADATLSNYIRFHALVTVVPNLCQATVSTFPH